MSNHLYARTGNVWSSLSDLTSAEMQVIDSNAANSIASDGGVYSIDGELTIGGSPGAFIEFDVEFIASAQVVFTDALWVFGDGLFQGANFNVESPTISLGLSSADSLTINSLTDFIGFARFDGGASFFDVATFNDEADFNGVAVFGSDATFEGLTIFDSVAEFNDQANFNGTTHFGGTVTLGVPLAYSASGRVPQRQVAGPDSNFSFSPASATHVYVSFGTISADHNYTISDAGAIDGDRIRFTNLDPSFAITVKRPGGTVTIGTLRAISGNYMALDAERIDGVWQSIALFPLL